MITHSKERSPGPSARSVEIITPSYGPDAHLCEELVASSEQFAPLSIRHTLIIPRRDRASFEHLVSGRTRLLFEDEVLPEPARQLPGSSRVSFLGLTPVRNWVLQQIIKLSIANVTDADVLFLVDSDSFFCRPFDETAFFDESGRTRVFANHAHPPIDPHQKWHRTAARLLGLADRNWFGADYITHGPVWHRRTLAALTERITDVTRLPWQKAVARSWNFSEYTLYGIYAEHVAIPSGNHEIVLVADDLAHSSWKYDITMAEDRQAFVSELTRHHIVVGIQSKERLSEADRRRLVASLQEAAALAPQGDARGYS